MGKLDILNFMSEDLKKEYSADGKVYIGVDEKIPCDSVTGCKFKVSCFTPVLVAMCIFNMSKAKMIDLHAPLSDYVTGYAYANKLSVQSLLRGESGIPDYTLYDSSIHLQDTERICTLVSELPTDERNGKNSSEIVLLCAVAESVSGKTICECIKKYVFASESGGVRKCGEYLEISGELLIRFARAWLKGGVVSGSDWRQITTFDEDMKGIGCLNKNGITETVLYGKTKNIYIETDKNMGFVLIHESTPTAQNELYRNSLSEAAEQLCVYPHKPRLVPYGGKNAGRAVKITPDTYQLAYVCDVPHALCYAYAHKSRKRSFVLEDGERAVGVAVLDVGDKEKCGIDMIMIDRRYQHKGYGKIMLTEITKKAVQNGFKKAEIAVNMNNYAALHMYGNAGFYTVLRKEDYVVMEKLLK
ncbi:MAG: GNAT family N-acetyltransferase [Clostridia bacterium]|nr:GNAT family N-acetyltransferase [Clostridia bacterium]